MRPLGEDATTTRVSEYVYMERVAEELIEDVYDVLLPDAPYLRFGDDDNVRYQVDPAVLEALAYLVTSVVLPFLVSVAANRFTAEPAAKAKELPAFEERERLIAEIAGHLQRRSPHPADRDSIDLATLAVRDTLIEFGWPPESATASAERIVDLAVARARMSPNS